MPSGGATQPIIKAKGAVSCSVPDFSTLSRRQKRLTVQITNRRATGPLNLLVDSTGIKFLGDGEWLARKHGVQGRRQWRKVHLAMDTATSDIRAVEFTSSSDGDSPVLPDLLGQIPEGEEMHRIAPAAPPTVALTSNEIAVLYRLGMNGECHEGSLADYLLVITRLGGYLARKSDPPPGNMVIWRGWSRLADIALGADITTCG